MNRLASEEFKIDFVIKTFVQETQFEQWIKTFFLLNNELSEEYNFIYQDAFYTKLYELFTEGIVYGNKLLEKSQNPGHHKTTNWYFKLIEGLNNIKSELSDTEFEYIEYRRHRACHIFQNSFEHIQENLRIKKERKGKKVQDIQARIQILILKHGSDKNIDHFLNKKLQPIITELYRHLQNTT